MTRVTIMWLGWANTGTEWNPYATFCDDRTCQITEIPAAALATDYVLAKITDSGGRGREIFLLGDVFNNGLQDGTR